MAAKKKGGVGSTIGCIAVLAALALAGWKFGPGLAARLSMAAPIEWGQAHENHGLRVRILAAAVEATALEDALGSRQGTDDLHVTLEILNLGDTAVTYRPPQLLRAKDPKLTDEQGRAVHAPAYRDRVEGQLEDGQEIEPHDKETHDLIFKAPAADAKQLILEVDMAMFGGQGVARFKIPVEKIDGLR